MTARRMGRIVIALAFLGALLAAAPAPAGPPDLKQAIAAQERHTDRLLATPGVVGTAVGYAEDGQPAVMIYTKAAGTAGLPRKLDGVAVVVLVTGELSAIGARPGVRVRASRRLRPSDRWPRPVPIGVSTGNVGECSAGTIGARVEDGDGNVYALSNNHIYAGENRARRGSIVLQPGRFDTTGCAFDPSNVIGMLADFERIRFSTSARNMIDAAIALSSTADLGNTTPPDGYGTPKTTLVPATVSSDVQKYGRGSGQTEGMIIAVNATVIVGFSSGPARFVDQIVVGSRRPFARPGDSGALVVTNSPPNPVGLLFASDPSGKIAIANRIDLVLAAFGVAIDGE